MGHITVRISDNEVLCTPTMHSKGFLKPEDISIIDMTGKQISGNKKRSSEALLHLETGMTRNPKLIKKFIEINPSILQVQQVVDLIARYKKRHSI